VVACLAATLLSAPASAALGPKPASRKAAIDPGWWRAGSPPRPLSSLAWLEGELEQRTDARIGAERALSMLRRYSNPKVERPGEWRTFWSGRYGFTSWWPRATLAWNPTACESAPERAPFTMPSFELAPVALLDPLDPGASDVSPAWVIDAVPEPLHGIDVTANRCAPWQRGVNVTLARHGSEVDTFRVLECDGSVALEALDRASVMARPPGTPRPGLPLPLEPDPEAAARGEWVPGVRLLDPRLVWVLGVLAEAFPARPIYVISGYRADAGEGFHRKGRALDLFVMGVKNEQVLRVCRKLRDVACGYYPNNNFVHVDVRPPGTGHALWVDVSEPGKPSRYVDAWPGVVDGGALSWAGAEP
jgi:hypothetical protein